MDDGREKTRETKARAADTGVVVMTRGGAPLLSDCGPWHEASHAAAS
jgi:hypothetical protein